MPERERPSQNDIVGAYAGKGQARERPSRDDVIGADDIESDLDDEQSAKRLQAFHEQEERAFQKNNAWRYMFPTFESSQDDVYEFFMNFGDEITASMMKLRHVDGSILLHMTADDLASYGMSKNDATTILERIETYRSQDGIRQSMEDKLFKEKRFEGVSALHDVVGPDGVFMISLDRKSVRFDYSANVLRNRIGVNPVKVSAVDFANATKEDLARGCPKAGDAGVKEWCQTSAPGYGSRTGWGCPSSSQQAVAASHQKALEMAQERGGEWTAILEDDAVPAPLDDWNDAFRQAWKKLPPSVKLVRLGWCQLGIFDWHDPIVQVPYANTSSATLIQKEGCCGTMNYEPGGCTTAYMVHKDILNEMLDLFPCCGPVDSCWKWDYFKKVNPKTDQEKGLDIMMSMDSHNKPLMDGTFVVQYGMFFQDRDALDSAQESFLQDQQAMESER